jgi:hypothetical protein
MEAQATFEALKGILEPYGKHFSVKQDDAEQYYLEAAGHGQNYPDPLFFGAVQIKKRYVAFHLMPVYANPALLRGISDDLSKRMQGKSCFNFKKPEGALLQELSTLTARAFEDYQQRGIVAH